MFNQIEGNTSSGGDLPVNRKDDSVATSATEETKENDDPSMSSKPVKPVKPVKPEKLEKLAKGKLPKPGRKASSKPKKSRALSPTPSDSESSLSSISMGYNESDLSSTSSSDGSSSDSDDSFDHRCCRRRVHRRVRYEKPSSHHRRRSEHSKSRKSSVRRRPLPRPVPAPEEDVERLAYSDSEVEARPSRKKRIIRYKDVATQTSPQKKSIDKSKSISAGTRSSSSSKAKKASHASKTERASSSSNVDDKADSTGSTGSSSNSKPKSSSSNPKPIIISLGGKPKDPVKVPKESTRTVVAEEMKHSLANPKLSIVDSNPIDTGSNTKCQTANSKVDVNPTTLSMATNSKPGEEAAISKPPLASIIANTGSNQLPAKAELMQRSIRSRSRSRTRTLSRSRSRSRLDTKSRSPIRNRYGRKTSPNSTGMGRDRGKFKPGAPPISQVRLHIKGLSRQVTKEHVTEIFGNFGPLRAVDFPIELYGDSTGRGFAFVEYANPKDCARAIRNMDGGQIDNKRIVVSAFRPNKVRATWRRRYSPVHRGGRSRTRSRSRSRNRSSSASRHRYHSRSPQRSSQHRSQRQDKYHSSKQRDDQY